MAKPSTQYEWLLGQYKLLHTEGEVARGRAADQTFPGYTTLTRHITTIRNHCNFFDANSVFDYGCGKGVQYTSKIRVNDGQGTSYLSLMEYWDINKICYWDPAWPTDDYPEGKCFDGVICCDVLEHLPEADLTNWVAERLFAHTKKFLVVSTVSHLARKTLPSGINAHVTVRPPQWWQELFEQTASQHPEVCYTLLVTEKKGGNSETFTYTNIVGDLVCEEGGIYIPETFIGRIWRRIKSMNGRNTIKKMLGYMNPPKI
jgi:hypothetical protein